MRVKILSCAAAGPAGGQSERAVAAAGDAEPRGRGRRRERDGRARTGHRRGALPRLAPTAAKNAVSGGALVFWEV